MCWIVQRQLEDDQKDKRIRRKMPSFVGILIQSMTWRTSENVDD